MKDFTKKQKEYIKVMLQDKFIRGVAHGAFQEQLSKAQEIIALKAKIEQLEKQINNNNIQLNMKTEIINDYEEGYNKVSKELMELKNKKPR